MKKIIVLLLLSTTVFSAWCDNPFYCDRSFPCRLQIEVPYGDQTYYTGPLDFTELLGQCGVNTTLDKNSLVALHDNDFIPIYFTNSEYQNSFSVFFKSEKGPGTYYIYFSPGSGRSRTTYFQQPQWKQIQNCSGLTENPDGSCRTQIHDNWSFTKEIQISSGNPILKIDFDMSTGSSSQSNPAYSKVYLVNDGKEYLIHESRLREETHFTKTFNINPKKPSTLFIVVGGHPVSLNLQNFVVRAVDFQEIDNFTLQKQSTFDIQMSEVFSQNTILNIKNNGEEELSDVSITSSLGNLTNQYFSFKPFEEKEILFDVSSLEISAQDIDFDIYFDSNGNQKISKEFLVYQTFISDTKTNFLIENNTTLSNSTYILTTILNNTKNSTFVSDFEICGSQSFSFGLTKCSKEIVDYTSFFVSAFELSNKIEVNLSNPFDFDVDDFVWQYHDFNKTGQIFDLKSLSNFSFSFSLPKSEDEHQNVLTSQQISIETIYYETETTEEPEAEQQTLPDVSDFEIMIFSPKHNEYYSEFVLEAFVDSENVNCTILMDGKMVNSTQDQRISQRFYTDEGNHTLELDCFDGYQQKTEKINFAVAGKDNLEPPETKKSTTLTTMATFDFAPVYIGAGILVFLALIFIIWKRKSY